MWLLWIAPSTTTAKPATVGDPVIKPTPARARPMPTAGGTGADDSDRTETVLKVGHVGANRAQAARGPPKLAPLPLLTARSSVAARVERATSCRTRHWPTMQSYLPLILFTVTTNALAQILLKKGMLAVGTFTFSGDTALATILRIAFQPFVIAGMLTFVISMASHLIVLSRVDLSFAYPFLSLAYVIVGIYSYFIFGENVNIYRATGIALICLGTLLIARS
jgi:multidrug transporter EmrE-like cation transporter